MSPYPKKQVFDIGFGKKKSKNTQNNNSDNISPPNSQTAKQRFFIKENDVPNPLWISISQATVLGGVSGKTIRRAIIANKIKYKTINDRYLIEITSLLSFFHSTAKLKNKLYRAGIGQYIKEWNS